MATSEHDSGLLEGVLLEDRQGEDDGSSQLEIDDFQSQEIRQIFLTTLPDYLEPVRQMLEQVVAGGDGREQLLQTLDKTLASIEAAATRIDIQDVSALVEQTRARLVRLGEGADTEVPKIFRDLQAIELMATAVSGQSPASARGGSSRTILAAFGDLHDLDPTALARLTAAGLVNVDQLRAAQRGEIVAVTGLAPEIVDRIMARVGDAAQAAVSTQPSRPAAMLEDTLRAQVEAEMAVDQVRGDILALKNRLSALTEERAAWEQRSHQLEVRRAEIRRALADQLAGIGRGHAERTRLERVRADQRARLERAERQLALEREVNGVVEQAEQHTALGLASLAADLERLRAAFAEAEDRVTRPAGLGGGRGRRGER